MTGQPTPLYRGLTVVRADMPFFNAEPRKRASSSASKLSTQSSYRSRTDSLVSSSNFSTDSTSSEEEEDEDAMDQYSAMYAQNAQLDDKIDTSGNTMSQNRNSTSSAISPSHSMSSTSSSASDSRASSLFSINGSDTTMSTQIDSDAYKAAESAALHARGARHKRSRRPAFYEPQPTHSVLVSTVLPDDIINPPLVANFGNNTLDVAQQNHIIEDKKAIVKSATFLRPRQADGISLRNFKTQCAKYATISDIVVYCPTGAHEGALNLAEWICQAQDACYENRVRRNLGSLRYNVFLVTEAFDIFEEEHPHLIAVDGSGFSRQRVDFIDREREEMQRFTTASEIDTNVFIGCTANVPFALDTAENDSSLSLDSCLPHEVNPHAFSICIETAEHGDVPSSARLSHASHYLDAFEATTLFEINSQEALRALNEDHDDDSDQHMTDRPSLGPSGWTPPTGSTKGDLLGSKDNSTRQSAGQQVLCPAPSNIVHLRALGSGSCFEDEEVEEEAIESVVNLISWMHKQAKPTVAKNSGSLSAASLWRGGRSSGGWPSAQQQMPRRMLLHCSDGYTDTSILALAYLMYARQLSLPEAYLDLQNRCDRCFFIYNRDVPFLQRLEKRISAAINGRAQAERHRNSWTNSEDRVPRRLGSLTHRRESEDNGAGHGHEQSVWARSLAAATGLVAGAQGNGSIGRRIDGQRTVTPIPRRSTPTPQSPNRDMHAQLPPIASDHSWFTSPQFQGSFPSRILPFLYLGNLSHAMNPVMLHALGITHVVSVGESALVTPATEESLDAAAAAVASPNGHNRSSLHLSPSRKRRSVSEHRTLWEEEQSGRIVVLDLKNVSDDGIDSLRPHMNRAIEFIEDARLAGGKVLVHCRVGVSRSATVCIAYVMAHCDLSMIESFLLVRSRRMNVLTQPTLLFVWELRGVEAHLIKLKEQRRQRQLVPSTAVHHDDEMHDLDDNLSLAALSISSPEVSCDSTFQRSHKRDAPLHTARRSPAMLGQSIYSDEDLRVDIGAGAGSVYGFNVRNNDRLPFNSGSFTRLDYRAARLTHGCFCKLLSELNARYMVA
jgi:dual specificity MAP kinase phosphatase